TERQVGCLILRAEKPQHLRPDRSTRSPKDVPQRELRKGPEAVRKINLRVKPPALSLWEQQIAVKSQSDFVPSVAVLLTLFKAMSLKKFIDL
ncbi:hypothetical protein BGX28_002333, partial [Mortierella sp. GBA30]